MVGLILQSVYTVRAGRLPCRQNGEGLGHYLSWLLNCGVVRLRRCSSVEGEDHVNLGLYLHWLAIQEIGTKIPGTDCIESGLSQFHRSGDDGEILHCTGLRNMRLKRDGSTYSLYLGNGWIYRHGSRYEVALHDCR